MKAKISLIMLAVLLWSSMAFAVNGTGYYNLLSITTGASFGFAAQSSTILALSQGDEPCSSARWKLVYNKTTYSFDKTKNLLLDGRVSVGPAATSGSCVASVSDEPDNLYNLINRYWVKGTDGMALQLWSDLDLGEYDDATDADACKANHVPLPVLLDAEFNGNGFTVSHLCYVTAVATDTAMDKPIGLFETVSRITLANLKIDGARILIDGTSDDGADYYPVGAVAGTVSMAMVRDIELSNVTIQGPFAGGIAGFVETSTVRNITGEKNIVIANKVSIATGYAGSKVMAENMLPDYQVFLGGLVGVALRAENNEDTSFVDDAIRVEVRDNGVGHKSALGGIAGLFSTTGESAGKLRVYSTAEGSVDLPTRISGGSAMGGLFGVMTVFRKNNSEIVGDFTLSDSRFEGEIYDAASPNLIAVGGLIGLDSAMAMMSVKILNSQANVKITDSLKVGGNFRYYAGGLLGYGSSCISGSQDSSDFFSFLNSRTDGSIEIAGSSTAEPGLHSQTYLGGLAGTACLAQAEALGLVNDTSTVAISSRIKTAPRSVYGLPVRDSLFVGGMLGLVEVAVTKPNILSGVVYSGTIYVEDSLSNALVGGIVGGFPQAQGGRSVHFKNITVNNEKLITYKAIESGATAAVKQTAAIGGLCGLCNEISMVERVSVTGNINATGTYSGDTLMMGGLIGSTDANFLTTIKNNFVKGNILVSAETKNQKVGYIWGNALINNGFEVRSNYHYGENDLDVAPFGAISTGSDITAGWKTNKSINYVVRNGAVAEYSDLYNGTEKASSMKNGDFAGFLNEAYKNESDYVWAYAKGINDGLPFFEDKDHKPEPPAPRSSSSEKSSSSEASSSSEESSSSLESSSSAQSSSSMQSSSSVESSSSVLESSSSIVESSSSVNSSSSVESSSSLESSSSTPSSSSVESSSSKGKLELVEPKIETSGQAVRLTFEAQNVDSQTVAYIKVVGENGPIVDAEIPKSVIDGGVWEMTPAPMGKFTVELVLDDQVRKVTFEGDFEVASEIVVQPESWQMVSLAALNKAVAEGDDDASFFWWDERNPVGDYWQYRAFTGGDVEPTRGFWYGTAAGKPLVLREATGSKDSEIVWELDSLYSGWNLMANPYGWYVDLTKGASDDGSKLSFWRWNPVTSNYDPVEVIGPYEAVWVKVPHALTWKGPAAPVFGISEKALDRDSVARESLKKKILQKGGQNENGWNIVATLSDEYGKKDSWNVLGAGKAESIEEPPAGMGNRVSLSIREQGTHGKKVAKLAKSVKPVAEEYNWTMDVSASTARDGKLSFEGVGELNRLGLKLFVTADGLTTEVSEGKSVNVALAKTANQVNVRVAASNVVASAAKISNLRATVVGENLQVAFNAPESFAGARLKVQLVDINGKISAAYEDKSVAGGNLLSMKAPKAGLYLLRVTVAGHQASRKVMVSR